MTAQVVDSKRQSTLDSCGAFASTMCALHCAACALLPATLTTLGLGFMIGHKTEWVLTIIAVVFAIAALVLSWRSHRNLLIMAALSIGITGLLTARVLEGNAHHDEHHDVHHADAHDIDSQDTKAHAEKSGNATSATTAHSQMHAEAAHTDSETHGEGHMEIELLSISAGILIVIGHISNLVILRRKKKDALTAECTVA